MSLSGTAEKILERGHERTEWTIALDRCKFCVEKTTRFLSRPAFRRRSIREIACQSEDRVSSFATSQNQINDTAKSSIDTIRHSVGLQLLGMAQWATDPSCHSCLHSVAASVDDQLERIADLAGSGHIRPFCRIALAEDEDVPPIEERKVRIGVYPLAANPIHWGHILVGLTALATLRLDKVIFIIAGTDRRKPFMVPAETRHRLGRLAVETFSPLFEYSPLALDTDLDGETNFGRLLMLNSRQSLQAYYIAGADHYRRKTERGEPDTIEKLEQVMEEQRTACNSRHAVAAVFVRRQGVAVPHDTAATSLNAVVLPPVPLSFSSTAVRRALSRDAYCEALVSLPYSCLLEIRKHGLYAGNAGSLGQALGA
jgi:nicotinic acid mononucleotide adenylyltransferase